jgi:ABC-type multidrug transport system fused ATPase/permease subunit
LDEANASVDMRTEAAMDAVVADFVAGRLGPVTCQPRTLLVIAHR